MARVGVPTMVGVAADALGVVHCVYDRLHGLCWLKLLRFPRDWTWMCDVVVAVRGLAVHFSHRGRV